MVHGAHGSERRGEKLVGCCAQAGLSRHHEATSARNVIRGRAKVGVRSAALQDRKMEVIGTAQAEFRETSPPSGAALL